MCKGDLPPATAAEGPPPKPSPAASAPPRAPSALLADLSALLPRPARARPPRRQSRDEDDLLGDGSPPPAALRDGAASDGPDPDGGVPSPSHDCRPRRPSAHNESRRSSTESLGLASFPHLSDYLAEEGFLDVSSHSRSSSLLDGDGGARRPSERRASALLVLKEGEPLDAAAAEALKDFALQLKFHGRDALDEESFRELLDDVGHPPHLRAGLFDEFLQEVSRASPSFDPAARSVTLEDMRHLYRSEPYALPKRANFRNGEALMKYVASLFRRADVTGDGALDAEEMRAFLRCAFEREPTEEELAEAMEAFDVDGDGRIDFDEFQSLVLRANVNDASDACGDFNEGLLSPSHASEEDFVSELETYAQSHRAVTHHLLANLASASFGRKGTADMLLRFLSAYSRFNSRFLDNVRALLASLDDARHVEVLTENLEEEMGEYDEDTLLACEEVGIPRASVEGIPHRELFKQLVEFVETVLQRSYARFIPDYVCRDLNEAVDYSSKQGRLGLLAALYFGSELIVPKIYAAILSGLRNSLGLSNEEARFLVLHIDMDQDHAAALREIILSHCRTKADRRTLVQCTQRLLDGRVAFYDALIRHSSADPMARAGVVGGEAPERTIGTRSTSGRTIGEDCIELTGGREVLAMCKDHAKGSMVLDVGCGDGQIARRLVSELGAAKVVGVDASEGMVEAANAYSHKSGAEYYVTGDVTELKETLLRTSNKTNIMPGAGFDVGLFDLSVGVYLFNRLTITDMNKTFRDIFSLLKPGGHFVFSVPHPFVSGHDGESFGFAKGVSSNYFALRDQYLDGHITTQRGGRQTVGMYCKTLEDYVSTARRFGFEVVTIEEASVGQDRLNEDPAYFEAMNGIPLHLVVKLRKPSSEVHDNANAATNTPNMLPRKLTWSKAAMRHPENSFFLEIPEEVKQELYGAALSCFDRGITVDDLDLAGDFPSGSLSSLKAFAASVRNLCLHETGVVLLKGLDLDIFGDDGSEKMVACSKIAYYLLCNHIGSVDGSARGRLFDVKDNHIDAMDERSDNILFSVSNCKANWHTDGASKDKVYDAVALLCIHPSSSGGKSLVSNACNAYDSLASRMPKFLLSELQRPVTRDILENGGGNKRRLGMKTQLSRADSILSLRMSYNSYPIFNVEGDRIRFRYMRFWIESAHKKMRWQVPTLLRIAMDVLDDTLDRGCCFRQPLERGDILICNNACVAHGRDSFKGMPGEPARHLVRAWMQMQKVDLLKPSRESP